MSTGSAGAATLAGTATIANPSNGTALASGGSTTNFTVTLPQGAACSGDTATGGYHVYSYLVQAGTDITTVTFVNFPSQGYGFVDNTGTYYGPANTAINTGQIIGIPTNFRWATLVVSAGGSLPVSQLLYSGTSGVWEAGLACANSSGHVTDYWNTEVTFTASQSDANGFTWGAVPGVPTQAPEAPIALLLPIVGVAAGGLVVLNRRRRNRTGEVAAVPVTAACLGGRGCRDVPLAATRPSTPAYGAPHGSTTSGTPCGTSGGTRDKRNPGMTTLHRGTGGPRRRIAVVALALTTLLALALARPGRGDIADAIASGTARVFAPSGAPLTRGGSARPFVVTLPTGARCPGDTAHEAFRVDSFLVPAGVSPTAVSFRGGVPSRWYGLIAGGAYVGAINTARDTGQIVDLPMPAVWSRLTPHDLFTGGATSSTWTAGIVCATGEGVVTTAWSFSVRFDRSATDRGGFTWSLPGAPGGSSSSWPGPVLIGAAACAGIVVVARGRRGATRRAR